MSQPALRQLVTAYFSALPPGRFLDVPCGDAWLSAALSGQGFECLAADLKQPNRVPAGVAFHAVDLDQPLPFADQSVDYVACVEGIEHVDNVHALLRGLGRVLRPGGTLVVTTPNILSVKSRLRYLVRGRFYGFPYLVDDVIKGEHAHISPVGLPTLDFAARRAGLERQAVLPYPVRPKDRIYLPLAWLMRALTRADLAIRTQPAKRAAMALDLATTSLLMADTLVVSYRRTASR